MSIPSSSGAGKHRSLFLSGLQASCYRLCREVRGLFERFLPSPKRYLSLRTFIAQFDHTDGVLS